MEGAQNSHLLPPDEFPFPYDEPYSIQKDFMKELYTTLEHGKLGIFESPTGTGKSQSLICGAFRWLEDHEAREKRLLTERIAALMAEGGEQEAAGGGTDWITEQAVRLGKEHSRRELQVLLDATLRKEERLRLIRKRVNEKKISERRKASFKHAEKFRQESETKENDDKGGDEETQNDHLLEEENRADADNGEDDDNEAGVKSEDERPKDVQIIICSRTHSQLSQLVSEVKKSPYRDSVRLVTLASRSNYCINPAVKRLGALALINERCCDLQNKKKKDRVTAVDGDGVKLKRAKCGGGCPYRPPAALLGEEALAGVMDVEDVVARGKVLSACPYYATRSAVDDAQVVVVPYNILLHEGTREACGLDLKGSVVIVDEAHNLLDAIQHIHSAEVTASVLGRAHKQLVTYRDKYKTRFTASNLLNLNQIIFIVNRLMQITKFEGGGKATEDGARVMVMHDFLLTASIDNLNMYKLLNFCKASKLSQKLQGFVQSCNSGGVADATNAPPPSDKRGGGVQAFLKQIQTAGNKQKATPVEEEPVKPAEDKPDDGVGSNAVPAVIAFMECLTNPSEDGRVICTRCTSAQSGSIKFLLLNPASHFVNIVRQARSVVVAGGTMKPISEFRDQLFGGAGANAERVVHFACGHVVSPDHILPIALTAGPSRRPLDFSYASRDSAEALDELGRVLVNVTNVVPAGVICFLTSYGYEQTVFQHLQRTGVLERIALKKKIFREPKESNRVDAVLQDYAKTIKAAAADPSGTRLNGALLFSVIGGKLSEGLNFSDGLGRCVLLVGMPYPSIKSAQLQEKMAYLTSVYGGRAGEEHYENLCMKAVNQTVGRAIRHKDDYAAIWLLDRRFARPATQAQLPGWIRASLVTEERFGAAVGATARFFAARKNS